MRHVRQEDGHGCGLACLAMVTGRTYAEVKAWDGWTGKNFRGVNGTTYYDCMQYLGDHGYATMLRFRHRPGADHQQRNVRPAWPTPPFAPAHLLAVRHGVHLVVYLPDGRVLDPDGGTRDIAVAGEVSWMLGVFRVSEIAGAS